MTTDSTGYRCALEVMESTEEHTKSAYYHLSILLTLNKASHRLHYFIEIARRYGWYAKVTSSSTNG